MKVLVTGGAGFIGSHIAQKLTSMGARVLVLDGFSSGDHHNLTWNQGSGELEII
jgi:nucleoside-diphosphate-sugar epimerase